MLQIRIGWLIYAMKLELAFRHEAVGGYDFLPLDIHEISPAEIKKLLIDVLNVEARPQLTCLQQRKITGALNKVLNCYSSSELQSFLRYGWL